MVAIAIFFIQNIQAEPIKVVTSFSIIEDIVQAIGQEHVVVTSLVGRNQDAHHYQITPQDIKKLSDSKLFFINGLGFEGWLTRAIEATQYEGVVVDLSEGISVINNNHQLHDSHDNESTPVVSDTNKHEHEHNHNHDHDAHAASDEHLHHHDIDPHVWQNPNNIVIWSHHIEKYLSKAAPEHAQVFSQNADIYRKKLEDLDHNIHQLFKDLKESERQFIMHHDAFAYFAKHYQLDIHNITGVANNEISAQVLKDLNQLIKDNGIKVIFAENIQQDTLIDTLVKDFKLTLGGVLYSDALTDSSGPAPTYLEFMQHNAKTIHDAIKISNLP